MNSIEIESRVGAFFDEFVEAFRSFSGAAIARRYLTPYLAFHSIESSQVFMASEDTGLHFQRIVDQYHAKGCRLCRYKDMAVVPLGNECVLGTVTWELLAEDQTVIEAWRESYNLCSVGGRYMVFASTDHTA